MEQKLFSIVTPAYNSEAKIEKTINSVLSQREDLFEHIIVDGASTDGTLKVVETYGSSLKLISEKDEGAYDAMNKGAAAATGKYIYFLGAGDSLKANVLEKIAARLPAGNLNFVYGNVYMVNRGIIYDGEFDKTKLRKHNICHQAIFYERTIFDVMGGFEAKYLVLADYVFNIKCFWNDTVRKTYLGYVIANYEGGGLSDQIRDQNFVDEYSDLIQT